MKAPEGFSLKRSQIYRELDMHSCSISLNVSIWNGYRGRVAFIAGTGSDTARAAGLEMRAVAPIWRYGAARAAAFRAVHRELLTSRRFSVSM